MVLRLPDSWSNWNLEMLVFEERGKPEFLEKNLSEQGREPKQKINPHMASTLGFEPGLHWWKASALTTAPPLLPLLPPLASPLPLTSPCSPLTVLCGYMVLTKKSTSTTSYLPNPETINQFPSGPPQTTRAPRLPAGPGPVWDNLKQVKLRKRLMNDGSWSR